MGKPGGRPGTPSWSAAGFLGAAEESTGPLAGVAEPGGGIN